MTLLQYMTNEFAKLKVDSPQAEARLVLEKFYNDDCLMAEGEADLSAFKNVFERRKLHEPIQYILGKAFFFNSEFIVDPSVLIPRPETEIMVEKLISFLPENGIMADIGCGSGCIGISVALERPDIEVYAFDISADALKVAEKNAKELKVGNIRFFESDLLKNCPQGVKFDAVGANLPYVPFGDYCNAQSEVRDFEPQIALTAENDGLEVIFRCVDELQLFTADNAKVFFEIDPSQDDRLHEYMLAKKWSNVEIVKDYTGRSRFVTAENLSKRN